MTPITSDQLRDIAVSTVEDFLNNKIPLSRGLAKQASDAQLNSEQIQRAVEATNTIAYLKVLGMTDDRTVEFPLAKFAEVMSLVTLPEKSAAELVPAQPDVLGSQAGNYVSNEPELFTSSSVVDDADAASRSRAKVAQFLKEAAANERALEELDVRGDIVAEQLVKQAKVVAGDEKGLDKLAFVVDGEDFAQLSVLVTGSIQPRRDFGDYALFKEAELKEAGKLAELYKEARRIVAESAQRESLQKRAEALNADMTKEAILGFLGGVLGSIAGRAIGGTIGTLGRAAINPIKAMAGRSLHNAVGPTVSKVTKKSFTPAKGLGLGTALGFAGSVGVDAAMYHPKPDPTTGQSGDVWDALQRS